ncbi:ATP-dependent nuclease [Lysinibacillus sp. NPDC098008]|uniref:ATP-dependent nuclease n=1 Tax=Lysinibacillus sp. NPDC098008 TaxID=3364146 RepID=UPI003826CF04
MSKIRINEIYIANYRSFGNKAQTITFPNENYKRPVAIVGYNNAGKTNLLNAILIGLTAKYVGKETFCVDDFHNRDLLKKISINSTLEGSAEKTSSGNEVKLDGELFLELEVDETEILNAKMNSDNKKISGAAKYYKIFYVNFHEIKKELSIKKSSWGNLTSFLAKFIKSSITSDPDIINKRTLFNGKMRSLSDEMISESFLYDFIDNIKTNYEKNLRDNSCLIEFGLPEYDDLFLEMIFKVGINGDRENLIPIEHFGDGYISMFVMSIIQTIAETNTDDRCVFIFEEPESFLHENHQEYFYKKVLCELTEKGHQVIYTTHSHKMIDIFDTRGLVRLEFDEDLKQSVVAFNDYNGDFDEDIKEVFTLEEIADYNNYIKSIEPNLNKIIFSKKVLLVEGPNDLMVYRQLIKKRVFNLTGDEKYAETYLNYKNIAIIPHHGKATAIILAELCKHLGVDYFLINDFDLPEGLLEKINFSSVKELQESIFYKEELELITINSLTTGKPYDLKTKRSMITNNYNLIQAAGGKNKIHFNMPKLEAVIGYTSNDKNSIGIWNEVNKDDFDDKGLFTPHLLEFLELDQLK